MKKLRAAFGKIVRISAMAHYLFMRRINKKCMGGTRVYNPLIIIAIGAALVVGSALMMLLYGYPVVRYIILASALVAGVIFSKRITKLLGRLFGGMREK